MSLSSTYSRTHHSKCFSTSSLSISKDTCIISFKSTVNNFFAKIIIYHFLRGIILWSFSMGPVWIVKCKLFKSDILISSIGLKTNTKKQIIKFLLNLQLILCNWVFRFSFLSFVWLVEHPCRFPLKNILKISSLYPLCSVKHIKPWNYLWLKGRTLTATFTDAIVTNKKWTSVK